MPKGRGANERRRSERQRHPKDKTVFTGSGYSKLIRLFERFDSLRTPQKRRVYR